MRSRLVQSACGFRGGWRLRPLVMPRLSDLHRRRIDELSFVAVTGSAGKTTTSLLAAAVLETAGRTRPPRQANRLEYVMAAVLARQPSDDFCVVELGAGRSGWERSLATVRPRIGVVTEIGRAHV